MRTYRGPYLLKTARGYVGTVAVILIGEIIAAMHAAAFLSRQSAAVHPARRCEHGCAFAGTKHVLSGGGIRLRNFGPEHIEPFKRPAEPARFAEIIEFVGKDLVLYRPGEVDRLERPFGALAQRHGPGR